MRPDAVFLAVVDRAQFQDLLEVAERPFDVEQALVEPGGVGGGQCVVGGGDQELAVQLRLGRDRLAPLLR
jgi:hypothetical protein